LNIYFAALHTAVDAGVVIALAGMGELLTERVGVLNLGQEGLIGIGAVATVISAAHLTTSPWIALTIGMGAAAFAGLLFAIAVAVIRVDQILAGLALVLAGYGISDQLGNDYSGSPVLHVFTSFSVPLLSRIPQVGPALFEHSIPVYITYLAVPLAVWILLFHTRHGMNIRAVGENPAAADALGVNVMGVRLTYTTVGAALSGAGGAFLMLQFTPVWAVNVANGNGWVALAVVIFAARRPFRLVLGALLFGAMVSLGDIGELRNWPVSSYVLSMLPYLTTIVLIVLPRLLGRLGLPIRHWDAPRALATPYFREAR
jgi:simple sugar transport system permease protein